MREENIRVLVFAPGQPGEERTIVNDLEPLQKIVGGYIEAFRADEETLLICNEEGRLLNLPPNTYFPQFRDWIHGTFFLAGKEDEDGEITSLSSPQIQKWNKTIGELRVRR